MGNEMTSDLSNRLAELMAGLSVGAFLAEVDAAERRLTLHVPSGTDTKTVRIEVMAALDDGQPPIEVKVKVLAHNLRDVARPRSVEHLLKTFASGTVIFDPTFVARRAQSLVDSARACRREFGKSVQGIYFDPIQRAMHVVMPAAATPSTALEYHQRILDITRKGTEQNWPFSVRVVSKTPRLDVTPVDSASAPFYRTVVRALRRSLAPSAIALAVTSLALPAAANVATDTASGKTGHVSSIADVAGRYGMLYSLSVFADSQNVFVDRAFTATGMATFFGDTRTQPVGPLVRVAQTVRRTIVQDTDSASGPAGASPGS
jgi:hypothetical protein